MVSGGGAGARGRHSRYECHTFLCNRRGLCDNCDVTRRPLRAHATAVLAFGMLSLAACSFGSSSEGTPRDTSDPALTPSATPSPGPSLYPSPSPSASEPVGPIVGAPDGTPVTPEIFLAIVDFDDEVLRVVVDVPGIYEDGGTCTVTVRAGTLTLVKENVGAADVSSTACGQFEFALSAMPPGTAKVTAAYESGKHAGTSEVTEVDIP